VVCVVWSAHFGVFVYYCLEDGGGGVVGSVGDDEKTLICSCS
jgi:hypothetical protein